jgi:ABC-type branched-subunit amino acid transport system substrate-binding protein
LGALLAIALLALAAGCKDDDKDKDKTPAAGETPNGGATGPLKIGVLMSFTGDLSDYGPPIAKGVELAVKEINDAGGVLGVPVETEYKYVSNEPGAVVETDAPYLGVNGQQIQIVQGDDATDPSTGVTEAQRLIQVEGVSAIIGALSSGVTNQIAESATVPDKILQISPASTAPTVTQVEDDDYLFRTAVSDETQGVALAWLADDLGYKSACVMFVNNDYGQGLSGVFTANFAGSSDTTEVPSEQQQATYASELAQCTANNPDVLVSPAYPESAGVFLREAVEGDLVKNFLFTDGTKSTDMFEQLGWDAFDGMYGTVAGGPTPAGDNFDAAYEAEYGAPPSDPYQREGYDAAYTIALAAQKAGSTDSTKIRDALRDVSNPPGDAWIPGTNTWAEAVQMIADGKDINYEGASGSVDYDAKGDVVGTIEIWKVDAATKTLVTEKVVAVDLSTKEVTEVTP